MAFANICLICLCWVTYVYKYLTHTKLSTEDMNFVTTNDNLQNTHCSGNTIKNDVYISTNIWHTKLSTEDSISDANLQNTCSGNKVKYDLYQ